MQVIVHPLKVLCWGWLCWSNSTLYVSVHNLYIILFCSHVHHQRNLSSKVFGWDNFLCGYTSTYWSYAFSDLCDPNHTTNIQHTSTYPSTQRRDINRITPNYHTKCTQCSTQRDTEVSEVPTMTCF